MKTKTKIGLAVGLLLVMILLLTSIAAYYNFAIKKDTQNILRANYDTLEYSRNMLSALDLIGKDRESAIALFEENIGRQSSNITEKGEGAITQSLRTEFARLKQMPDDEALKYVMRADIFSIMQLNMHAIKIKSDAAQRTADTANLWLGIAGTLCFLIAFNLLINLPHHIANPIQELTQSIGQIAAGNYAQRVHFANHNEFGELARSFNTMGQKLQEYNNSNLNELLVEKKRNQALLGSLHDPVLGLDEDGKVRSANEQALKIMGLAEADAIGKTLEEIAQRNDLVRSLMEESNPSAKPFKIFADGKESYFEKTDIPIKIIPTGEENPVAVGRFILLRNITVFKELDFAKTNFIATVSHELKTPIASAKLSLKLLEQQGLSGEQRQLVDSIGDDADRLLKITGELLEMSQLETGNIQLAIGKCEVQDMVAISLEAVRSQADQRSIALVPQLPASLPALRADRDKTSWVLINFLTNAIRYAPEHSRIEVEAVADAHSVQISVLDHGQGIDPKYQPKLFDRYFQVPGQSKSGTGLGLAISREFIEAQGGSIGVESNLGLGARFWFQLPIFT